MQILGEVEVARMREGAVAALRDVRVLLPMAGERATDECGPAEQSSCAPY